MTDEPRVTGIGGVFFKARNPGELARWYQDHLGIVLEQPAEPPADNPQGATSGVFMAREHDDPNRETMTIWATFPENTTYLGSQGQFMINYRVRDLDGVLAALREEGVWVDDHRENHEYGRFAWVSDPEGNRIELWEPPSGG